MSRLVQVVDLGSQHFKPGDNASRKIYFGFETCNTKHVFKEENGPEPFMLQSEFAFYMTSASPSKQTKLRQFILQWRGKDFGSEKEAREFDFSTLLGGLAMLTVAHKLKADGTPKAVIADVYNPTQEHLLDAPEAHNPMICYEIENGEDANFAKLPAFLQRKIRESDEFNKTSEPEKERDPFDDDDAGDPY